MRDKFLIILLILAIGIFYIYDYKNDKVNHKESDLLQTIQQRGYIIVGVKTDTRPFGYIENGKNVGFDIDIAKRIARDIFHDENKIKFVEVTPATRLYRLNSNEVDMVVATMTITAERQGIVDFSTPYYIARESVMVKSGSNIKSLSDLTGHKVGVLYGSTGEKDSRLLLPTSTIQGYRTYNDAYNALKLGHVSAVISGDTLLRHYTLVDSSVKLLPKKYSKEYYAIAVRKNSASKNLLNIINVNLSSMNTDGSLMQLKYKWKLD